mgnify:CR=1 FL=1
MLHLFIRSAVTTRKNPFQLQYIYHLCSCSPSHHNRYNNYCWCYMKLQYPHTTIDHLKYLVSSVRYLPCVLQTV